MSNTKSYYEALKNEEYKALLDSEVQSSIAKENALKYMNNSINAQGYGGQGVAESSKAGVYSQYSNALANAQNTYRQNINAINENERQALKNESDTEFQTLTSLMNSATNQTQLNDIIGKYGVSIGKDGTFVYGDDNQLSPNDRKQLEIVYSLMNSQLENANYAGREAPLTGDLIAYNNDGGVEDDYINAERDFENEIRTLRGSIASGSIPNNSYIHIKNERGRNVYLVFVNGQFYYTSASDYNNNKENAYYIHGYGNITKEK